MAQDPLEVNLVRATYRRSRVASAPVLQVDQDGMVMGS